MLRRNSDITHLAMHKLADEALPKIKSQEYIKLGQKYTDFLCEKRIFLHYPMSKLVNSLSSNCKTLSPRQSGRSWYPFTTESITVCSQATCWIYQVLQ